MQAEMRFQSSSKRAWPMGYPIRSDTLQALSEFKKTSLATTLSAVALVYLTIGLSTGVGVVAYLKGPALLWVPLNLIALILIGRSQRALECMTHEASHYNWSRNPKVNDFLANLLSALPVFSTVGAFREGHLVHHNNFGTSHDPDKQRYSSLRIEDLDRSSFKLFVKDMLIRVPAYALSWYKNIRLSPLILLAGLAWHLVLLAVPLMAITDPASGLLLWAVYWVAPMTVVLTLIRFIGESGEHQYGIGNKGRNKKGAEETRTVFDSTITNCGRIHRLFFHPVNDGYHLTHHLYPAIPHMHLKRAHAYLTEADPGGYGSRQKYRTRILEQPRPE